MNVARSPIPRPIKVFVPYINGHIYDLWGGEPNSLKVFASRAEAERFNFTDIRELELWLP